MTLVRFAYSDPTATGRDAAVRGGLRLSLLNRETVDGRVRTTRAVEVGLAATEILVPADEETGAPATSYWAGVAFVELSPTGAGQGWEVLERAAIAGRKPARVFAVPVSAGVVNATDLVELDRATLVPTVEALAGWQAALDAVTVQAVSGASSAGASAISAAAAEQARLGALGYRTDALDARDDARESRDAAAVSASAAAGSASAAVGSASAASGSASQAAATLATAVVFRKADGTPLVAKRVIITVTNDETDIDNIIVEALP